MGLDADRARDDAVGAEALAQQREVIDAVEQRHDDLRLHPRSRSSAAARCGALTATTSVPGGASSAVTAGTRGVLAEGRAGDGQAVAGDRPAPASGYERRRDARARELGAEQGADGARAEDGESRI